MRSGRPMRTCLSSTSGRQLAHARELAGAAGQHDAAAGDLVETAMLEARAHQLEGLLRGAAG